jgi:hypothetical protein
MHVWLWDVSDMEARVELNPLSWRIGVAMGPLGVRLDIGPLALGLVWGEVKKSGTSQSSVRERHANFVHAYLANRENATQAYLAIKPHVSAKTAGVEGHRLLKLPSIQKAIDEVRAKLRAKYALTPERVAQELARLAYFNTKRMLDEKGKPKKLHEVDEDTAAALTLELDGDGNVLKVRTPPPAAKNTAVRQAVRILRLEDKPPPPPPESAGDQPVDWRDVARRTAFLIAKEAHEVDKEKVPAPKPVKKKVTIPA